MSTADTRTSPSPAQRRDRVAVLTRDGLVVSQWQVLADAAAGLIASLHDDHRHTPDDLLAALALRLDEPSWPASA